MLSFFFFEIWGIQRNTNVSEFSPKLTTVDVEALGAIVTAIDLSVVKLISREFGTEVTTEVETNMELIPRKFETEVATEIETDVELISGRW